MFFGIRPTPRSGRRTAATLALSLLAVSAGLLAPSAPTAVKADTVGDIRSSAQLDGTNLVNWSQTVPDPTCSTLGKCYLQLFFEAVPDYTPPCLNICAPSNAHWYRITNGFSRQFEPNCGCYGPDTEWTVTMNSEDWFNGNGSGNQWVNGSCQAYYANDCNTDSHGAFWDDGIGASTDWDNRTIQENCGELCPARQKSPWLRTWVYPSGNVNFGSGT